MNDLLPILAARLGAEERRDGRYHADCPFCGKEAKRAQKHFSFCAEGYICFVCGEKGGLAKLAQHLDVQGAAPRYERPAPRPQIERSWQQQPERYLERYCGALDRLTRWQAYKPLAMETIARFRLGVGVLAASRCHHRRLIVPVFDGGQVVAFHGRAFEQGDDDAKWLTSGGSRKDVLYNAHLLRPGAAVVICENLIDALLAMQEADVVAVAGGGVAWREEWSQQIAVSRPRSVLVALDNDSVGWPNPLTQQRLLVEWHREMAARLAAGKIKAIPAEPEPNGPKIANQLVALGVRRVSGPEWPASRPPKWDLGSELLSEKGARQ